MASLPNPAPDNREPVSAENVVRVAGLTKVFKDFWGRPKARAVSDVSFDIRRGEIFGLLGPNGSGKSTTIKMLLGLLYPTRGHIEVFGQSPRDVRTKERIGYLPEESYLYKYLNPGETLDFFGNLFQLDSADRRQRAEQLIEMVGLNQARTRTVGEFSKGMQRRIGLAQALINDPDLVILDEPTAGLDPLGCREVKDLILALARRGKTVILSSHLLADVEEVCDRVVIYYGGRIQAMGTLQDLLAAPDSVQITMPVLSREVTERVLGILRAEGGDRVRLGTPTQNLETYFLGVVERARAGGQTSGTTSGNRVAQFIRGEGTGSQTLSDKVLDRLTRHTSVEDAPRVPAPSAEPRIDHTRLSSLARNEPAATPPVETHAPAGGAQGASVPGTPAKGGDLKAVNEKLSGLLGGKK